jgi:putative phosphonate metabolism protein
MRYAIYWTPPVDAPLARLGAAWLGRDAATGEMLPRPLVDGFAAAELETITAEPRRYGLHATLKPPFRLASGRSASALESALAALAGGLAPTRAPALQVRRIEGFLALTPAAESPELAALAAACVTGLDEFRAPADAAELARRRAAPLTPGQEVNLLRWGYPYVLDEFRFHVTVTGLLEREQSERLLPPLSRLFAPALQDPLDLAEIALFVEPAPGAPFLLARRFPLGGQS